MSGPTEGMSLAAFLAAKNAIFAAARSFDAVTPNCRSCLLFDMGHCKHYGAPIPAEFQQADSQCEHWAFDALPF